MLKRGMHGWVSSIQFAHNLNCHQALKFMSHFSNELLEKEMGVGVEGIILMYILLTYKETCPFDMPVIQNSYLTQVNISEITQTK